MAYRKRYEDSYLDDEDEEFDGDGISDGERLAVLIKKETKTDKDTALIEKLTSRIMTGSRMPAGPGAHAKEGLLLVANTYKDIDDEEGAIRIWTHLLTLAEETGDRELYYKAIDGLGM